MGAAGDVLPVLRGVGGHQVKDGADVLRRRGDVVQFGGVPAGFVDFQLQAQPFAHGVQRDGVHVVCRFQPVQGRQGFARCGVELRDAGRREVLEFSLAARHAERRGEARVEPDEGVRVGVGDGVDGCLGARGGCGFGSHPTRLTGQSQL